MKKDLITYNDTVKEAITLSTLNLIQKKELNRISISEIIKMAGVSRSSFYRNFETKEQVLILYIQKKYRDYFENELSAIASGEIVEMNEFLKKRFRFVKENQNFFIALRKNNLLEYVFEHMEPELSNFLSGNVALCSPYYLALFSGACAAIARCWIDRRFLETEEEMLELLLNYKIISSSNP